MVHASPSAQEVGHEAGGSQVSPVSTTPFPHVIVPTLPPEPETPPVCGAPPVARPPAPPAPASGDVSPVLPPAPGFDDVLVPPCPPRPPVGDVIASARMLASPTGVLPESAFPERPSMFRLQPRNQTKTADTQRTAASRCMTRLLRKNMGQCTRSGPRRFAKVGPNDKLRCGRYTSRRNVSMNPTLRPSEHVWPCA
jgi:hypothetical protein